jgi:hypothetical protein
MLFSLLRLKRLRTQLGWIETYLLPSMPVLLPWNWSCGAGAFLQMEP